MRVPYSDRSVRPSVCLSGGHTFLVVTYMYIYIKLCFAGDTCIPRNAATMFVRALQNAGAL